MVLYDLVKVLDDKRNIVIKNLDNQTVFSDKVGQLKKDKFLSKSVRVKNIRICDSVMLDKGYFEVLIV